ncbi:MAG: hypothetical protein Q8P18_15545 [Pseudomonadota bacterium]|nr:hypothetical protein [Pseudomonadota bacterium]
MYEDEHGIGTIFAGQPDHDPDAGCDPYGIEYFGHIYVDSKMRLAKGDEEIVVLKGEEACDKLACLMLEMVRITEENICYWVLGPNSNSAAYTLLTQCGIPALKPDRWTPGWGHVL